MRYHFRLPRAGGSCATGVPRREPARTARTLRPGSLFAGGLYVTLRLYLHVNASALNGPLSRRPAVCSGETTSQTADGAQRIEVN